MSQLDQLPPDQRAALSLILRQGRSYEDVGRLLRIDPDAVRERALAALRDMGPRDPRILPPERRDEIADYLLGQQSASQREETREYLEESAGGRAWGRVVSSELRPLAASGLPEIPSEGFVADEHPDPEPRPPAPVAPASAPAAHQPRRPEPAETGAGPAGEAAGRRLPRAPRSVRPGRGARRASGSGARGFGAGALEGGAERSRVGQAMLLLGLGVIVAALIILILEGVIFGGGGSSGNDTATLGSSSSPSSATSSTTTSSSATSSPRIVAQIQFVPTSAGGHAAAVANVAQQGNQKAFALVASGLAPTKGFAYAVWLVSPSGAAEPLGFIDQAVSSNGRAAAEGVLPSNESQFKQIVVTKETAGKPTRPGTIVLAGQLNP